MKLRQQHVKTFRKQVAELEDSLPKLFKAVDYWLEIQREREVYGNVDQTLASLARGRIEAQLDMFRERIGDIYDHMAEKGMRDVETTRS